MIQWYIDTVIVWYSDTVIEWYSDTVIEWYSDTVIQWYSDTVIQCISVDQCFWCSSLPPESCGARVLHYEQRNMCRWPQGKWCMKFTTLCFVCLLVTIMNTYSQYVEACLYVYTYRGFVATVLSPLCLPPTLYLSLSLSTCSQCIYCLTCIPVPLHKLADRL